VNRVGARCATVDDGPEIVRLARLMYETMGAAGADRSWEDHALDQLRRRLGRDAAVYVVDNPDDPGRLAASMAGTINHRLPGPLNPTGLVGYAQWACTDPRYRRRGFARLVMVALLDWFEAHGVRVVELHSTPFAEDLYRSLGFSNQGPRAFRRRVP
jgi:GNAT superfamily N-acetyltransferase